MRSLVLISAILASTASASATPISFTGAELAGFQGITFPTGTPTVIGNSLRIDATATNSVLASIPLSQFTVDPSDFEIQLNLTRLLADSGFRDQDFNVYLSDGLNLFGSIFQDVTNPAIIAGNRRDRLSPDGRTIIFEDAGPGISPFAPVEPGESFLASFSLRQVGGNTEITSTVDGFSAATGSFAGLFDLSNGGPSLVFAGNSNNENYLINSVTFTRGLSPGAPTAVSEPGAIAGLGLGLTTLALSLYRRRRSFI